MNLYLVHCGFYDEEVDGGLYESHTNLFVAAETPEAARAAAKQSPLFKSKRMHVDGLQEIAAVGGYRIHLAEDAALAGETRLRTIKHRDLAPRPVEKALEQKV